MLSREGESLKEHTSFRVGGQAALYAEPEDVSEVRTLISESRKKNRPFFILGAGSNLLVRDEGFPGTVISTRKLNRVSVSGRMISAECGVLLSRILKLGVKYGMSGFEFLAGIPGTVGGALLMNSGVRERSISKAVSEIRVLDEELNEVTLSASEITFSYRFSSLARYPFVISAIFKGEPDASSRIKRRITELVKWRIQTQPRGFPSAGSIFRNPGGEAAGKMIDETGCKGWRCGGAVVSEKHANFIINDGNASASDILNLMARVQDAVYKKFGVRLEPEIRILG